MTGIVDYGVGNLFSLRSSLKFIGEEADLIADPDKLRLYDRIILPGVGAFGDAAKKLQDTGLGEETVRLAKSGKPVMGICLGMQLLLDKSLEFGEHRGLGLISGEVRPISETIPKGLKIPHIGWNGLDFKQHEIFKDIKQGDCVYFVHSFHATSCPDVVATTDYGAPLAAAVAKDSVVGCQFHPEKSGEVGLKILRAFCRLG